MSAASQIFASLAEEAHKRADLQRQQQASANAAQAEIYKPVLSNPNATPEQREYAATQLDKLYKVPGQTGGLFGKLHEFINSVKGHQQSQTGTGANPTVSNPTVMYQPRQMQLGAPTGAPPMPAPVVRANELGDTLPALSTDAPSGVGTLPPLASDTSSKGGVLHRVAHAAAAVGHAIGSGAASVVNGAVQPAGLAPAVSIDPKMLPAPPQTAVKWDAGQTLGSTLPEDAADRFGNPIDHTKTYKTGLQNGKMVYQQAAATPSGRAQAVAKMSANDVKRHAAEGMEFNDQDGKPIDVSKLAPTEMLVKIEGAKPGYVVASQNQKNITVGNQVYGVGNLDIINAPSYSPSLGTARQGGSGSHEQLVTDANTGETRAISVGNSRGVSSPGINRGMPPLASPSAPASSNAQSLPALAPTAPQSPKTRPAAPASALPPTAPTERVPAPIQSPAPSPAGSSAAGRLLPGVVPTGQAKGLRDRNTAINAFGTALENATKQNGPGNRTYLDMFKDPAAMERVGNFLRLNNAIIEKQYTTRVPDGITGAAEFYAGIPQSVLNTQNEDIKRAYAKLTPQDQHDVAMYYNGVSHLGGTRKASGGLASQASMRTMLNDFPSPLSDRSYGGAAAKMQNLYAEQNQYAEPNLKAKSVTFNPGGGQRTTSTGHKVGDPIRVKGKDLKITKVYKDGTFDAE